MTLHKTDDCLCATVAAYLRSLGVMDNGSIRMPAHSLVSARMMRT
jgi:hypothetical protein